MTTFEMVESSVDYFIWACAVHSAASRWPARTPEQKKRLEWSKNEMNQSFTEMKKWPDEWLEAVATVKTLRLK